MNQRGFLPAGPMLYAVAGIAGLALISGIVFGVKSYLNGIDERAYARGVETTKAEYTRRDNAALHKALARIAELEHIKERLEQEHAARLAKLAEDRKKEIDNAKAQRDRDVAAVRAGTLRLRDPGTPAACPAASGGGPGAAPVPAAGLDHAKTGAELSPEFAEFLIAEASRADEIVIRLSAAQDVINSQMDTCNANQK